jgi:UDP-N-acetylmuramoyl-tripeptide--D-alanyl-D-alanine ligase
VNSLTLPLVQHALRARQLRIVGDVPHDLGTVATDTRAALAEKLFVALVGERFDAHEFVEAALKQGARAVLVQRGSAVEPRLEVDDTLLALQDLAAAWLLEHPVRRVALTGSNGKTTTKELIAGCLKACLGDDAVLATTGNLNNHVGLPLTALRVFDEHRACVLEMGMNHIGEIARLCEIASPEVGLVTNIGLAHAGNVGGIEGVARAKGELFAGLAPGGTGVINLDDHRCVSQADRSLTGPRVTFGAGARADVRLLAARAGAEGGLDIELSCQGKTACARVPYEGQHNALNAAGAVAVAVALGLDFEQAVAGLARSVQVAGRLVRHTLAGGGILLDDSYNANPDSMRAGFATLASLASGRPMAAALGEMLELGDEAEAEHEATGRALAESGVKLAFFSGPFADAYRRGTLARGLASVFTAPDSAALAHIVADKLERGHALLVKGSRGARMERVVERLLQGEGT